jgi:hypothetical protein
VHVEHDFAKPPERIFAATPGGTHFVYEIRIASPIPGLAPIVRAALTRSISRSLAAVERDA